MLTRQIVQKGKYLAKGFKKEEKSKVLWRISLDILFNRRSVFCGTSNTINQSLYVEESTKPFTVKNALNIFKNKSVVL